MPRPLRLAACGILVMIATLVAVGLLARADASIPPAEGVMQPEPEGSECRSFLSEDPGTVTEQYRAFFWEQFSADPNMPMEVSRCAVETARVAAMVNRIRMVCAAPLGRSFDDIIFDAIKAHLLPCGIEIQR